MPEAPVIPALPAAANHLTSPNANCMVAIMADNGSGLNEIAGLHNTLDTAGYTWVDVTNITETRAAGANVLIDRYAGYNIPYADISDWLNDGYGHVQLGDWPYWFPDNSEGQPSGTLRTITVADAGHPLAAGLPPAWTGLGFWAYDWEDWDALGWIQDTSFLDIIHTGYTTIQERVVSYKEVGAGHAGYIGFNTYGPLADAPDNEVVLLSQNNPFQMVHATLTTLVGEGQTYLPIIQR